MSEAEKDRRFNESGSQANRHTCRTLLNCYIREFCRERPDLFSINPKERTYAVSFRESGVIVSGKLSYCSAMGEHEYESFFVNEGKALDYTYLVQLIIKELKHFFPFITEERAIDFSDKVDNSYHKLALFLQHSAHHQVRDYLSSEQSLLYGHPFHPFPKNTLGFTAHEVGAFCPELRPSFQLCYFAVRKDVYQEEWVSGASRIDHHQSVEAHALHILKDKKAGYEILPAHPWQYEHVQTVAAVKEYIRQGKIIPLGSFGPLAFPTSSVRTVYIPDLECNIKLPLNIQITNMMRNNNREQMRRTLDAADYLLRKSCFEEEPNTMIAYEEGVCTCLFENDEVTKLFTAAYRPVEFDVTSTYVLSALVEAPVQGEPPRLFSLIHSRNTDRWFRRYLDISLLPIVRIAEEHGIHFEAHLQNSLLTIRNGLPHTFIIRDLEGVSVNLDKAEDAADPAGPLFYSREAAWARTSYYFVVNHLGSLIHALAVGVNDEEERFWAIVQDVLTEEYERHGNEYVLHLLTADYFYAKQNLLSCLTGQSETPSYVPVHNVMKKVGSESYGNNKLLV
ncbi:IucA/IucC family siderophore biosynthesis protein [Paenibacillus tarimensis]